VNVKRAVATAAGVLGALLLTAVVGLGHVAGHAGSGAGTQARAAVTHTAPVRADLTAYIYGDSVNTPATSTSSATTSSSTPSYVDDSSSYTSTYGSDGSTTPASSDGTTTIYGDGTSSIYGDGDSGAIYGDGDSIYGDGSDSGSGIYGDSSTGTVNEIYGD
jgi:hypothetical protein